MKRNILLDLNHTLISNSEVRKSPFLRQIEGEKYSPALLNLIRDRFVVLITARPARFEIATLDSLARKTGWEPQIKCFNHGGLPPPETKRRSLQGSLLIDYQPADFVAIESNPATRAMYAEFSIPAYTRAQVLADPSLID